MYLKAFLRHGQIEVILDYIKEVWASAPSNTLKLEIIRRITKKSIFCFDFLEEFEPDKFLFALSLSDTQVKYDYEKIFNRINEQMKPYALLSLSRIATWDNIKERIEKYL